MKAVDLTTVSAVFASATLTSNGTNVSAGDTVTVAGRTYTFRAALTGAADEVRLGTTATESLIALAHALNGVAPNTGEHTAATAHDAVRVGAYPNGLTLTVVAREAGTAGNALAVSTTAPSLNWSGATLSGGADTLSLAGALSEAQWLSPAQQVSVLQRPIAGFPRTLLLTDSGVYAVRWEPGAVWRVGLGAGALGALAAAVCRALTPVPRITTQPRDLTVLAGGEAGTLISAATAELPTTYQWELEQKARATLTWDGAAGPDDGDTVTIAGKVYTFRTALTPVEGEVLRGGDGTAALLNLARAINRTGTPGTDYYCAAAHPTVRASAAVTANAITIAVLAAGALGNGQPVSTTASHLSWDTAVTVGGGPWVPVSGTMYDITHTGPTTPQLGVQATGPLGTGLRYRLIAMNAAGWAASSVAQLTVTV